MARFTWHALEAACCTGARYGPLIGADLTSKMERTETRMIKCGVSPFFLSYNVHLAF